MDVARTCPILCWKYTPHWLPGCPPLRGLGANKKFICRKYMPQLCKFETCRKKAVYGFENLKPLFCSAHRDKDSKNVRLIPSINSVKEEDDGKLSKVCKSCEGIMGSSKYKGFCTTCYVNAYPQDPLSLQTLYKSKSKIIQQFIDSKFDGFSHLSSCSKITINKVLINVSYDDECFQINALNTVATKPSVASPTIFIKFNPNKYVNADGSFSNPMLYTRLPLLEKEISSQIERVMNNKVQSDEFSVMNFSK